MTRESCCRAKKVATDCPRSGTMIFITLCTRFSRTKQRVTTPISVVWAIWRAFSAKDGFLTDNIPAFAAGGMEILREEFLARILWCIARITIRLATARAENDWVH